MFANSQIKERAMMSNSNSLQSNQKLMIRRHKWLLRFSIIYWLIIILGVVLNILALQKVPLESYGLRTYFFSPSVDPLYYTSGLYNIGVGYYFITFPSSKQYVLDNQISVVNQNLEKIDVKYTFCYRINPNNIYALYEKMGYEYETYLIAAVNNIISSAFMAVQQSDSRVTIQAQVVAAINANGDKISTVLSSAVAVEGLWIQQLQFSSEIEKDYQNAVELSDSYHESYEITQLEYQKTRLQVLALQEEIALQKQQFTINAFDLYNSQYADVVSTQMSSELERATRMSYYYSMKRIWTYYNSTRLVF